MIDYSIDLDAGPVVRKLKKIGADMGFINKRILSQLSEEVITEAQGKHLRGRPGLRRVTGKLAQSLTYRANEQESIVGTNLPYAAIHEFGGVIKPKKGNYLRFMIGEQWIMAKQVKIPARPYLNPSLQDLFGSGRAVLIADRELQRQLDQRMG